MTLIDITILDPSKTYVCNEISTSKIAKIIQGFEHKKFKKVSKKNLASHTFALINRGGEWFVYENHLKWGGIKEYSLSEYEELNKNGQTKRIEVNEYPLNLDAVDYWRENNPGYSVLNLFQVGGERLVGLKLPDTKGWICSETIAACNFDICLKLNLPFTNITPADWQIYFGNIKV